MTDSSVHRLPDPLLVPRPSRLERLAGTCAMPAASVGDIAEAIPGALFRRLVDTVRTDADWVGRLGIRPLRSGGLPAGGYRLVLRAASDGPCTMESAGPAGDRAALATLAQLLTQYSVRLPALAIDDAPAFAARGAMLDVSRDRLPTMAHFQEVIDLLGSLKINHLQLYTEHAFAYPSHEAIWRGTDPIFPAEVVQLDEHCRAVGIELAANQNCFGHLHKWLAHPDYKHLAEIVGDATAWDFLGMERTGPFSLCPIDPAALAFVDGLLAQLLPHFSSPLVNIGCDETADVGQGRSRAAVTARGHRVYGDFVAQVARCAIDKGARPMFWADIALEHPECLADLPADLLALAWGYEADTPFDQWGQTLREMGRPFWVCPGTSSWRSITGRTSDRKANLENAAKNGVKYKAEGFMVTDWGDGGHRQQWPITLRGLADAADAAWTGPISPRTSPIPPRTGPISPRPGPISLETDPISLEAHHCDHPTLARAISLHAFGDRTLCVAQWLDELGDADEPLRAVCGAWNPGGQPRRLRNAGALFVDLHKPLKSKPTPGTLDQWCAARDRLDALARALPEYRRRAAHTTGSALAAAALLADECAQSVGVARFAADRGLVRRSADGLTRPIAARMVEHFEPLAAEHRRLWRMRSRPGGLAASSAHDEKILAELRTAVD